MNTIKTQNNNIITRNGLWSDCCCGTTEVSGYWEAIPCDLKRGIRNSVCGEWEQCQLTDRLFVGVGTKCIGGVNNICECQSLDIGSFRHITGVSVPSGFQLWYFGDYDDDFNFIPGSAIITNDSLILGLSGWSGTFSLTGTLSDIDIAIGSDPDASFYFATITTIDAGCTLGRALATGVFVFNTESEIRGIPTKAPFIQFEWSGNTSSPINYSSNFSTFANNIQNSLTDLIGTGVSVAWNSGISTYNSEIPPKVNNAVFDIQFGGNLCGIRQPNILVDYHTFVWNSTPGGCQVEVSYGDYNTVIGETPFPLGGPIDYWIYASGQDCPYEIFGDDGPAVFSNLIKCCPQRGDTVGPNQDLRLSPSGYCWNGCGASDNSWTNLETTFTYNGECYHISPYWFLFGKNGRFTEDYDFRRKLFINPDCNFGVSGACGSGGVPCNSFVELFLPQFHKNITWGPFGSYYFGVDETTHTAWEFPYTSTLSPAGGPSFLSENFATRYGKDYAPQGVITTRGTWTETKEIFVRACIRRPIPFYVGTSDWDDIDYYVSLDPASISPDISVDYPGGEGCGCIHITFDTSGKTIGQFINAINDLRTADSECEIFAFCPGSEEALSIPASKIINVSAESFENWVEGDGDGPEQSTSSELGSSLVVGNNYMDMFSTSAYNHAKACLGQTVGLYPSQCLIPLFPPEADPPPICWGGRYSLPPKVDAQFPITKSLDMWWTTMQGCDTVISRVSRAVSLPDFVTSLSVNFTDRRFNYAVSGNNFLSTGFLSTNKSGSGYLLTTFRTDLQAISISNPSGSPFNPFLATTGVAFSVYLDDMTRTNAGNPFYGPGPGTPTTENYSYREIPYNADTIDIFNSLNTLDITAWIRRRCDYTYDAGNTYNDPILNPAISPLASKVNEDLLCSGDETYDDGTLIGYGCNGEICLEEFYIPSIRCGCDTVSRCLNGAPVTRPHPFNQEGDSDINAEGGLAITQPRLYVCEYNFHPEYDIPVMVKVPFQIRDVDTGVYNYQNGVFGNGVYGPDVLDELPYYHEFCSNTNPLLSNAYGWCQYIDFSLPKVPLSEIERNDPPVAIIIRRTKGVFFSKNPWNYRPEYIYSPGNTTIENGGGGYMYVPGGCNETGPDCAVENHPACPSCEGWDRMVGAKPMGSDGPIEQWDLTVLFRPAISNLTQGDVCGTEDTCPRLDINCATACCECYYVPNASTCCPTDLVSNPWSKTTTVNYSRIDKEITPCGIESAGCSQTVFYTLCPTSAACGSPTTCCIQTCPLNGIREIEWSDSFDIVYTSCEPCSIDGGNSKCISAVVTPGECNCPAETFCLDDCASMVCDEDIPSYPDICFNCETSNGILAVPSGECCGGGNECVTAGQRVQDVVCGYTIYRDDKLEICSSSSFNCLGNGAASWDETLTYDFSGVSVVDGEDLGYFIGCTVDDGGYHPTYNDREVQVSYTVNPTSYASCTATGPSSTASYDDIINWRASGFSCGYPQINVASGIESVSEGFFGISGCFP
jgi:hypothetical protein